MPGTDVQKKIQDGYRIVKFSEVNDEGSLTAKAIQTLVEKNYYSDIKFEGGQVSSKRRCVEDTCTNKMITFVFEPGNFISQNLGHGSQYVAMAGVD